MEFRNSSGALQKGLKELESSGSSRSEQSCFVFLLTGQEFSLITAAEIRAFWFVGQKRSKLLEHGVCWQKACPARLLIGHSRSEPGRDLRRLARECGWFQERSTLCTLDYTFINRSDQGIFTVACCDSFCTNNSIWKLSFGKPQSFLYYITHKMLGISVSFTYICRFTLAFQNYGVFLVFHFGKKEKDYWQRRLKKKTTACRSNSAI